MLQNKKYTGMTNGGERNAMREQRMVQRNKNLTKSTKNDAKKLNEWCPGTRNVLERHMKEQEMQSDSKE